MDRRDQRLLWHNIGTVTPGGAVWHIERDLTDYSPLFKTTQNGKVDLGNV